MKTLEVTDEQYAHIQRLREILSEEVVGKYGYVRERDAIQFLIDTLDDDLDIDIDLDDSSALEDVNGGEPSAESDADVEADDESDPNEITYDEDEDTLEPDEAEDDDEASDETDAQDDDTDAEAETEPASSDVEDADDADDASEDDDEDEDDDDTKNEGVATDGAASDDDMLDQMMNLLDTHDDKWEESPSADYRYRVDLPDGTTEDVQTKDDVRAILFKNYR